MSTSGPQLSILLVDDNEDDALMAKHAFAKLAIPHQLQVVTDGRAALDYLNCAGKFAGRKNTLPDLLLLDINMPGMDGFSLLKALKADKTLRKIPVVMLTTSSSHDDVARSYECGAASFLTKPDSFDGYHALMGQFSSYWMSVSLLPE